jgi:hypothetical protein
LHTKSGAFIGKVEAGGVRPARNEFPGNESDADCLFGNTVGYFSTILPIVGLKSAFDSSSDSLFVWKICLALLIVNRPHKLAIALYSNKRHTVSIEGDFIISNNIQEES